MTAGTGAGPVVHATVSAVRPVGGYDVISLSVASSPGWGRARPGQLVVVPVDPGTGRVLPHVHWLAGVDVDPVHGTTVELVLPAGAPVPGERLRLLGPLGRGFPLPAAAVPVLVVAHEGSAAPVRWLVQRLRGRGCPVHVLLSADDPDRHLDPGLLRRLADSVVLTSPDALPAALAVCLEDPVTDPALVLATGPDVLVRRVVEEAVPRGRVVRVAALDPGSGTVCGTGVCGSCDLLVDDDGRRRRVRPCLEGPALPGEWLVDGRTGAHGATR